MKFFKNFERSKFIFLFIIYPLLILVANKAVKKHIKLKIYTDSRGNKVLKKAYNRSKKFPIMLGTSFGFLGGDASPFLLIISDVLIFSILVFGSYKLYFELHYYIKNNVQYSR